MINIHEKAVELINTMTPDEIEGLKCAIDKGCYVYAGCVPAFYYNVFVDELKRLLDT